jgi:hypothetical protein
MDNQTLYESFLKLSTPLIADACLRVGVPIYVARIGIRPLVKGWKIAGRVLPARHYGSVDIFLEAMQNRFNHPGSPGSRFKWYCDLGIPSGYTRAD